MPVVFDTLQKASFAGFTFPVEKISAKGALRYYVHEYPHSPGGAPEKLGRKLYEWEMDAFFGQGFPLYPQLYPETLQSLRIIYDGGGSFDLVVPTFGKPITAFCTEWEETAEMRSGRTGVRVRFKFLEDQSNLFLVTELIAKSGATFASALANYAAALADQRGRAAAAQALLTQPDALMLAEIPATDLVMFEQVSTLGNGLLATISAAVGIGTAIVEAAAALVALCVLIDATATTFDDPTRYPLLIAFQDVWATAQTVQQDALNIQVNVVEYVVPTTMSVSTISIAIYGDTTHASEIMQTNPEVVDDPFAVPQGTVIKAYIFDQVATAA